MSTKEIIIKINSLKKEFLTDKTKFDEVLEKLKALAVESKKDFTTLYNCFYSSQPEIYLD
jgi:hypothetical protein